MRIIINADDFGYSHTKNMAIEKAILEKRITSSTIMANAPGFEEAIDIARRNCQISYGVHLNLIEFAPLTNKNTFRKYDLLDEAECFIKGMIFSLSSFEDELKQAIKEEWIAQIKKVKDFGIQVTHVDSHQHTHNIVALQDILLEVLSCCNIVRCRTRLTTNPLKLLRSRNYEFPNYGNGPGVARKRVGILKKLYNHFYLAPNINSKWLSTMRKKVKCPDDILSYHFFVQDVSFQKLRKKDFCMELECHPGLELNEKETKLLMEGYINKVFPAIELITYREL